jgi:hypothetical protein
MANSEECPLGSADRAVLRRKEASEKVAEICRKAEISEANHYAWKKHQAGLGDQ